MTWKRWHERCRRRAGTGAPRYLANLLEAIQRCVYFLSRSERKLAWPLSGEYLTVNKKDAELFETMAAVNERFAKLQDTQAAAIRHGAMLLGEPNTAS